MNLAREQCNDVHRRTASDFSVRFPYDALSIRATTKYSSVCGCAFSADPKVSRMAFRRLKSPTTQKTNTAASSPWPSLPPQGRRMSARGGQVTVAISRTEFIFGPEGSFYSNEQY
ncbi:hypothetical protein TYRP_015273 [Tyrophagus putrescentiae]|nr:hypothetical protein TYRP_015273 [Tyrophagus putrescentiae]